MQSKEEQHISEAAKVVGGVICCKTVILWLGCHGNSVSWVSHVPVQRVIPVAPRWRVRGEGLLFHAYHHFKSPMRIKQTAVVFYQWSDDIIMCDLG